MGRSNFRHKQSKKDSSKGKGRGRAQKHQGRTPPSSRKVYVGTIQKNPKGFAFVIPRDRQVQDAYVGRQEAMLLMSGDTVEFLIHREGNRSNAKILRILERGRKSVVGIIRYQNREYFLESPTSEAFWIDNKIESHQVGQWVIAQITTYPSPKSSAHVRISQILGKELTPEFDILIAISQFGLHDKFSPKALEVAEAARAHGESLLQKPPSSRKDLRNLPFVTIDGEDAKDFDDAICVEQNEKGFRLYVAIADVSFFVSWNSALDKEARDRGTSVYFPGTCLPMLPEVLSNDACSLRGQEDKLTLTAQMDISHQGEIIDAEFYESIIKTRKRLTYTQVHNLFTQKKSLGTEELDSALHRARALFRIFENARRCRGVLDFELGETKIIVDAKGVPTEVQRAERFESHRLIEEFMIAANSAVAKALRLSKVTALHRVHEAPDFEKLDEINNLMRSLGISHVIKEGTPKAFAKILAATKDVKGAKTLHQTILRAQKQARYEPDPKGHFGLALRDYAHFTSPIRRYPDLVVHRALKQLISRQKSADIDYVALGESTSQRERIAMEAERFVTRRKECWFLKNSVGETMKGTISSVIEKGCFIELEPSGIEGFLPIESLEGHYVYDEQRLCFRRRPGHTLLAIGDPIEVLIEDVRPMENQITLGKPK